jgi:hypothetical protein
LPGKTDEAKQAIYERARAALRKALRSPFSETELVAEQAALEVAISMVEGINATTQSCDEGHLSQQSLGSGGLQQILQKYRRC